MKPVYSNLTPTYGVHQGGVCKIEIAPIEWLSTKLIRDFANGCTVIPALIEGKEWIVIEFTPDSYSYDEKPKTIKAGTYFETSVDGTSNDLDASTYQLLETLRYHQFIAIVTDRKKRKRICGTNETGMTMQIGNDNKNTDSGKLTVPVNLQYQNEKLNPFLIEKCIGIENFTDCYWHTVSTSGDEWPMISFTGGNDIGNIEVEFHNTPSGTIYTTTILAGERDFIVTDELGWSGFIPTNAHIVRWRKVCPLGQYTAWSSKSLTYIP